MSTYSLPCRLRRGKRVRDMRRRTRSALYGVPWVIRYRDIQEFKTSTQYTVARLSIYVTYITWETHTPTKTTFCVCSPPAPKGRESSTLLFVAFYSAAVTLLVHATVTISTVRKLSFVGQILKSNDTKVFSEKFKGLEFFAGVDAPEICDHWKY